MKPHRRKKENGFTLIEIMIVVGIIGILAAIAIPNFLNLKDKAIWGTAKGNLIVLRNSLAAYAAHSSTNKYPVGTFDFAQLAAIVPKANLPSNESQSKFRSGTFTYGCADGEHYIINVNVDNRAYDALTASPSGITPDSYEAYVR